MFTRSRVRVPGISESFHSSLSLARTRLSFCIRLSIVRLRSLGQVYKAPLSISKSKCFFYTYNRLEKLITVFRTHLRSSRKCSVLSPLHPSVGLGHRYRVSDIAKTFHDSSSIRRDKSITLHNTFHALISSRQDKSINPQQVFQFRSAFFIHRTGYEPSGSTGRRHAFYESFSASLQGKHPNSYGIRLSITRFYSNNLCGYISNFKLI